MSPSQITTTEQFLIISTLWILLEGKKVNNGTSWQSVLLSSFSQITSTAASATTQSAFLWHLPNRILCFSIIKQNDFLRSSRSRRCLQQKKRSLDFYYTNLPWNLSLQKWLFSHKYVVLRFDFLENLRKFKISCLSKRRHKEAQIVFFGKPFVILEQQKGARTGQMLIAGNFEHSYLIVGFWLNSFSFSGQVLLNSYLAELKEEGRDHQKERNDSDDWSPTYGTMGLLQQPRNSFVDNSNNDELFFSLAGTLVLLLLHNLSRRVESAQIGNLPLTFNRKRERFRANSSLLFRNSLL